jgi:hypothetical protein
MAGKATDAAELWLQANDPAYEKDASKKTMDDAAAALELAAAKQPDVAEKDLPEYEAWCWAKAAAEVAYRKWQAAQGE